MEIKDYTKDYPGVEPELFWCVANTTNRVELCQGFKGVWTDRPDDWYFPAIGYSSKPPFVYKRKEDAIKRALDGDFGLERKINDIRNTYIELKKLAATPTQYDELDQNDS